MKLRDVVQTIPPINPVAVFPSPPPIPNGGLRSSIYNNFNKNIMPAPRCINICNPIVIAVHPDIRRTGFSNEDKYKINILDLDSPKFKEDWPAGYISHIITLIRNESDSDKLSIILIDIDRDILSQLICSYGIRIYIAYPDSCDIGNGHDWNAYANTIAEMINLKYSMVYGIKCKKGQTISDIISRAVYSYNTCSDIDIAPFYPIQLSDSYNTSEKREFLIRCINDYRVRTTVPVQVIERILADVQKDVADGYLVPTLNPVYQLLYDKGLI